MKVDQHLVKVSAGYVYIDKALKIDKDVILTIEGNVTKTEDKSNQDGTVDRVYTVKGTIAKVDRQMTDYGKNENIMETRTIG